MNDKKAVAYARTKLMMDIGRFIMVVGALVIAIPICVFSLSMVSLLPRVSDPNQAAGAIFAGLAGGAFLLIGGALMIWISDD